MWLGKFMATITSLRTGQSSSLVPRLSLSHKIPGCLLSHPESFRSNAQIAIMFARRNRPRVHRNDEFACVYLHLRSFASTVRDRPLRAYVTCVM